MPPQKVKKNPNSLVDNPKHKAILHNQPILFKQHQQNSPIDVTAFINKSLEKDANLCRLLKKEQAKFLP